MASSPCAGRRPRRHSYASFCVSRRACNDGSGRTDGSAAWDGEVLKVSLPDVPGVLLIPLAEAGGTV
ncbi:hypothetical protein ACIF8T_34645 [Streptomyces sp. NPDC085946]|uniref:hypothetical protein n=1 Tax=Streptomyces sp. NPDC085946 TaxID=3365744 RepID=UPI0037CD0C30